MFRDNKEITTAGRYYFAPTGTQHYPGWHQLGSRNYHDKNWPCAQSLGEDLSSPQTWDRGTQPALIPLPLILGSRNCIELGETGDGIDYQQLNDGIPLGCYLPAGESNPLWFEVSSYDRCSLQLMYLQILIWMYDDAAGWIEIAIHEWLGDDVMVKVHPSNGFQPSVTTIVHTQFSVAIVDGTRDFQQFALQAFQAIVTPTNFGILKTLPLWYEASQTVINALRDDGAVDAMPVMLVGHSYGACAAVVAACRLIAGAPTRTVRYMTFGMPKPGDQSLKDLIDQAEGVNIVNDDDVVGSIPPNADQLLPVAAILGVGFLSPWNAWKKFDQSVLMRDGSTIVGGQAWLDTPTLLIMAGRAIAGEPQLNLPGHRSQEYFDRTARRCPKPEWPVKRAPRALPAIGLTSIDIPRGTIGLCGTPIAVPGSTCDAAILKPSTFTYADVAVSGVSIWLKMDLVPGPTYHFHLTAPTHFSVFVKIYEGTCLSHINVTVLTFDNPTLDFATGVAVTFLLEISDNLAGPDAYILDVNT